MFADFANDLGGKLDGWSFPPKHHAKKYCFANSVFTGVKIWSGENKKNDVPSFRHAKRLFLSGNQDLDSEMSGQFIRTNLLNKGSYE